MDTLEDQKAFAEKLGGIRFPLISDPDGEITKAYGAQFRDGPVARRCTVVIGRDGTVLKSYAQAPPDGKGHAEQVLNDVRGLVG